MYEKVRAGLPAWSVYRIFSKFGIFGSKGGALLYVQKSVKLCKKNPKKGVKLNSPLAALGERV